MNNAKQNVLRSLTLEELENVSGGFANVTFTGTATPFTDRAGFSVVGAIGPGNFVNANDRSPQQHLINARLLAAYAANPDVPRSQVYADFFNL
jgi:hypothetical protein